MIGFVVMITILCIGASVIACNLYLIKHKEEMGTLEREITYWKKCYYRVKNNECSHTYNVEQWKRAYYEEKTNNDRLKRIVAELQRNSNIQKSSTPDLAEEEKVVMVKALKKAMFDLHPDRNPGKNTQEEFIKINQLYKKLK